MEITEIIILGAFVLVVAAAIAFVAFPAARVRKASYEFLGSVNSAWSKRVLEATRFLCLCFFLLLSVVICADLLIHLGLGRHVNLAPW